MVDPQTGRCGKFVYNDLGLHEILDTTAYPVSGSDLTAASRAKAMAKARYFVFGIGGNSTIIGDRKAGLQSTPQSSVPSAGYYNRYLMVVKMSTGPNDMTSDFAGILDPQGKTVSRATEWATRTGN